MTQEISTEIKLCNLTNILDYWSDHRLHLWRVRIADLVSMLEQESLELGTQAKILQNHQKFLKALSSETLKLVKLELSKFIDLKMIDYALSLKVSQVLKLNEAVLTAKYNEAQEKFLYWSQTTPIIELRKQLEELVAFYEEANFPYTTTYINKEDLPTFGNMESKSNWIVVTDKGWELSQETPIRGRGFNGNLVSECKEFCTFIDSAGQMEGINVFAPTKRLGYEKEQLKVLLVSPDRNILMVGLGEDSTLICRVPEESPSPRRAFSRVPLKTAICIAPQDQLVVQFDNGRIRVHSYEELLKKATVRVAVGFKDRLLGHKVGIRNIFRAYQGNLYVGGKVTDIQNRARLDGIIQSLGERNFCVNPSGQRMIVNFEQIVEGLEFICPL